MTTPVPAEPQTRAARRQTLRAGTRPADAGAPVARPRPVVAAATVVTGLVLSAAAASGEHLLWVGVLVVAGLVVAVGWPRLVGSRSPGGAAVVLAVTALALGVALGLRDAEPFLEHVPAALATGIIAMCLHPLVQASARVDLARALTGTGLGVLIIGGSGLMLSTTFAGDSGPPVVVGISVAVAALADLALERRRTSAWMLPVAMLVGAVVGVLAHLVLAGEVAAWPALLGVTASGTAVALRRVLAQQPAIDTLPGAAAAGVSSVLVVAPLVHLVARLPLG
ncbi:hypothetical protein [Janibacter sp. LM]|uniref:hypothetical protein n=1 Tax=Janibacter sp. LM TaxID=3144845 RepID=UPI0031F6B102